MIIDPQVWTDISNETVRTYHYPSGFNLTVPLPLLLNIQSGSLGGHAHRIQTETEGIYVAPGWAGISWKVKEGTPIFTF